MSMKDLVFILGGEQGAGLETSIQILTTALTSAGYSTIADREYFSNIKGRHSYIHCKTSSSEQPLSLNYDLDLLGCMDAETLFTHFNDLKEGGYLIYDKSTHEKRFDDIPSIEDPLKKRLNKKFMNINRDHDVESLVRYLEKDINIIELDYPSLLDKLKEKFNLSPSQSSRYISSILIGAVGGLLDIEKKYMDYSIERRFGEKEKIVEQNKFFADFVSNKVKENWGSPIKLEEPSIEEDNRLLINGNEAVGMGKILAGMRFQSYYPITPAADESFFIEEHSKLGKKDNGIVVFQTEDELSAIAFAIGSSLTGTRSSTSTSGPGFSLMVEGLGWAGMNEVPLVITYYQRCGPSTGMPTRGSQSDLFSSLFASHGEFPRIVLSSGDHKEAFRDAVLSFNLAERYQTPVIHLLDKFLANSVVNIRIPDITEIDIERGKIDGNKDYKRFKGDRISKRNFLGNKVMWYTGSEHNEYGNVTEDPQFRIQMEEKRMNKFNIADKEIQNEKKYKYFGNKDAEFLLVGWGSVKGVCLDSISTHNGAYLHIRMLSPFPSNEISEILKRFDKDKIIFVDHTYSSQISKLVSLHTAIEPKKHIVKFTGRPIYLDELNKAVASILEGENRVVLEHGP